MNSIISTVVPRYIVLCARLDPTNSLTYTSTAGNVNAFLQINKVSLNIGNLTGILSNASTQQLYQITKSNGYDGSYIEWFSRNQGFFIAEVGKDIGGFVPGSAENLMIQPKVTFTNNTGADLNFTIMECFFVTDGFLTLNYNAVRLEDGLAVHDVVEAMSADPEHVEWTQDSPERHGKGFGSVFRTIRNVFGAVAKPLSGVLGMIPHPGAQLASHVIDTADRLNGGKLRHKKHREKHGSGKLLA